MITNNKIIFVTYLVLVIFLINISLINPLTIDSVSMVNELKPAESSKIIIGIKNDGDEDLEDVSIKLDLKEVPFAPFNSASEVNIDKIAENKIKYAEFEIIALNNAKSGIYKIPLTVSYNEDDIKKIRESLISVLVDSKPIIDVNIDQELLLKGKENEAIIRITNKGLSDVKFLEIEIKENNFFNLLGSKKYYIGDIDSNDFDTLKIKFFINYDASDVVSISITVKYKDELNKEYEEEFNLSLKNYTEKKAVEIGLIKKNKTALYTVGVVSVLILYLLYRNLKKRSKKSIK